LKTENKLFRRKQDIFKIKVKIENINRKYFTGRKETESGQGKQFHFDFKNSIMFGRVLRSLFALLIRL